MKASISIYVLLCLTLLNIKAQNPVFTHLYTADPSAHVWPGDNRLWLYTSHDEPGTNAHYTMSDYHVFSTTDLVNWTDYGRVLHFKDVDWAESHAWAIDAVYYRDKYYLVFCAKEKITGIFRTGLAISDFPQGPFKNIGFVKGVDWGQDPSVLIDDDGKPYLYWGCGGSGFAAELNDDLMSIKPETKVNLSKQLFEVFEGLWCHKYNGKYYLTYPGLPDGKWPQQMYYATADKPLGPYTYRGKYMEYFDKQSGTNHGSVVKFNDKWLAFYHSAWLSGGLSEVRSTMMDYLTYDKKGNINKIIPSQKGLGLAERTHTTILLEAENGPASGGILHEVFVNNYFKGYSGTGYVDGFDAYNNYVTVLAQVAKAEKYRLKIRYASPVADQKNDILINFSWMLKQVSFPKTESFEEIDLGLIDLKPGDNEIRVIKGTGGVLIDYIKLEQVQN